MANKNFKVKNSITIPEPLALTEGGTGQTSAGNALNALLPVQSSAANKFLQSDGTNVSWIANVAYERGGTESRPGSPSVGDLYYNTDNNYFESYTSNGWFPIAAAPGIPTGATATNQPSGRAFNNGQMSVAFTPNTNGGSASSFIVTPTPTTSPTTFTGGSSPVIVTGLASSTQYTYTVSATSPYGTSGASSASSGVTATTVPQAPTINSVTAASQSAIITFTAGATGGSEISQYTITSSPSTTSQTTSSSPYTFTGLTDGTSYTFTMTATNANGTSLASSASSSVIPVSIVEAMEQIGMVQVGSAGSADVTFSSIPSTYKHLQIRFISKSTFTTGVTDSLISNFNSDAGANYSYHFLRGDGSAVTSDNGVSTSLLFLGNQGNSGTGMTNIYGVGVCDILDYANTNKYKTIRNLLGFDSNGDGRVVFSSSSWRNTNAITSIKFSFSNGNIASGSQFALYGIKG
jgi:hypothetical protein